MFANKLFENTTEYTGWDISTPRYNWYVNNDAMAPAIKSKKMLLIISSCLFSSNIFANGRSQEVEFKLYELFIIHQKL